MGDWLETVLNEIGDSCGNCGQWRRLIDDYFLEKCPNCGDEEVYVFDVEEREIRVNVL